MVFYEVRVKSEIVGRYEKKKEAMKAGVRFKKYHLNKGSRAKIKILKFVDVSQFY